MLNGKEITVEIATNTLKKAINSQTQLSEELILHSDQCAQYTSSDFINFCKAVNIQRSMSKAGFKFDNDCMERYYNTLKIELIYQHYYHNDERLNKAVNSFAYA